MFVESAGAANVSSTAERWDQPLERLQNQHNTLISVAAMTTEQEELPGGDEEEDKDW